jgi:hypothetical protein
MNINRLRPDNCPKDQLDLWISRVINDALRDVVEAGLSSESAGRVAVNLGLCYLPTFPPRYAARRGYPLGGSDAQALVEQLDALERVSAVVSE